MARIDVQAVVNNIHEQIARESKKDSPKGSSLSDNDLLALRVAYRKLYDIRNLVGQAPPSPDTLRARIGARLVRIVQRMLFWYTPQILRFHNETAHVLGELCKVAGKQAEAIAEIQKEIHALHREFGMAALAGASPSEPADATRHSASFEFCLQDHFRGSERDTAEKLRAWLNALEDALPAGFTSGRWLDIGCGRGEWLAMAAAREHDVIGIDASPLSIAHCSAGNLHAEQADAVRYLQSQEDGSLAVITAFHIVEHMKMGYLQVLLALAARKLAPGGILAVETPDPANLLMASHHFWNDPTHQRPIPMALLEFMFRYFGLGVVRRLHLNPFPQDEHLIYTEIDPVRRVDELLYGTRDYGLIGRRES
jgi:SAM-dependent methyltransferase